MSEFAEHGSDRCRTKNQFTGGRCLLLRGHIARGKDHAYAKVLIEGVGKDTPTITNTAGGSQSAVPYRFDLIDAKALFAMAEVLHEGAEKYGVDNWRKIPVEDHLNHAIGHIYAWLAGDRSDDHLSHALCRITFANGVDRAND